MIEVEIYPQALDHKVFPLYAGLFDLEDRGEIAIRLKSVSHVSKQLPARAETLFATVSDTQKGKSRLICFDMVDWSAPAKKEQLEICDIYFKRSFRTARYKHYAADAALKIRRFGLGSSFMSPAEHDHAKRAYLLFRNGLTENFRSISKHNVRDYISSIGSRFKIWRRYLNHAAYAQDWQYASSLPKQEKVLYQTRAWGTPGAEDSEKMTQLNDTRAETVRLLRAEFGSRFVGGLIPNDFAIQHYPDCLTNLPTKRGQYIELVRNSLVAISTIGLNDSNTHKLAEYLAATCCIVSEPLKHELPEDLVIGQNMELFESPTECVDACSRLLSDKRYAQEMRDANDDYYNREVAPAALIRNRIMETIADL